MYLARYLHIEQFQNFLDYLQMLEFWYEYPVACASVPLGAPYEDRRRSLLLVLVRTPIPFSERPERTRTRIGVT